MEVSSVSELSPRQKAAIVVMTLGSRVQGMLKKLGGGEVEQLAEEILQLGDIPTSIRDEVLIEFQNRLAANQAATEGGLEKATEVLEVTLGKDEATRAVKRIEWRANEILRKYARRQPSKFAAMVEEEHPQTGAFLLTQVQSHVSGQVISLLPEELQSEVIFRVATMSEIAPQVAAVVHDVITRRLGKSAKDRMEKPGGEEKVAGLLNMVPADSQKSVLEIMQSRDEDLAKRVRKLMFVFKDILLIDDRGMQRVLKEVDTKLLVLALKTADPAVQEKIFNNVSERAAQNIKEEMEYMTQVKPADVEMAQDTIIEQVRALEEEGEIVIDRGGAV